MALIWSKMPKLLWPTPRIRIIGKDRFRQNSAFADRSDAYLSFAAYPLLIQAAVPSYCSSQEPPHVPYFSIRFIALSFQFEKHPLK
jgi:hypothetical protein